MKIILNTCHTILRRVTLLIAVALVCHGCTISYKFNGASIDYSKVKTISVADFTNNAYLSIFTCGSTQKGGAISSIVPFASHIDHTNHFIDAVITEYGVADLRRKSDMQKAKELIKVAHPDYRPMLEDYLRFAQKGG